jgi:dipeptidyl aminopeptidase/acylaminoacyl peptidase
MPDDTTTSELSHTQIAERLIDGRSWVTQPAVSPGGARVAFVVATTDLAANTTRTRVWLDDAPVTRGDHDGNPAWSPDGRWLAFTSRRGEKQGDSTLHVLPIATPGEVRTLCTMPDGLDDVAWSPDGRWLGFISRVRDARYAAEDVTWQAPRKVERFLGRLNGENWVFDRPKHVHVVAADGTGKVRDVTPGEFQHRGVGWLADSTGIVTSAARHDTWDTDFAEDLYVVPLDDDHDVRCLTAHDGSYGPPVVSPDGTRVAFVATDDLRTLAQNAKVGVLPLHADGASTTEVAWISDGLDRTFECVNGMPRPVWRDDSTVLAVAEDRGAQHLYALDADGSAPPTTLVDGPLTVTAVSAGGGRVATTRTTVDRPAELWFDERPPTDVAAVTAARTRAWERFLVPTTDGTGEIDAWIMRPASFDPARRYPVLLNVHGGPFTQYGEFFFDEAQMQAAAGFVVILGNPRGSSGRHTAWGQAIHGPKHPVAPGTGWGSVDVEDVLAILDGALDRYPFCDAGRVGMLGGSYGGFMATWLAGRHGDRFRAICSERAANNLLSMEWSSDIATMFRVEHGLSHVDDPEEYASRSPVNFAADIHTPMLIIHSEEDWRCPIVQAEELWMALKLRGREVEFHRFPGESHELSRSG